VADIRYRLGESLSRRLDVVTPEPGRSVRAPAEPLRQTLIALVKNAFDASAVDQRVQLVFHQDDGLRVEVIDRGRGMTSEESARAGEPFFTTKPRGSGLGLGLFLARAFADQMGGTLEWRSTPGQGTAVTLALPAEA
jgi:two-component system sensor histidine kinase RegB